jgi:hypothetical protein
VLLNSTQLFPSWASVVTWVATAVRVEGLVKDNTQRESQCGGVFKAGILNQVLAMDPQAQTTCDEEHGHEPFHTSHLISSSSIYEICTIFPHRQGISWTSNVDADIY